MHPFSLLLRDSLSAHLVLLAPPLLLLNHLLGDVHGSLDALQPGGGPVLVLSDKLYPIQVMVQA